jgi:hypothetical protein
MVEPVPRVEASNKIEGNMQGKLFVFYLGDYVLQVCVFLNNNVHRVLGCKCCCIVGLTINHLGFRVNNVYNNQKACCLYTSIHCAIIHY